MVEDEAEDKLDEAKKILQIHAAVFVYFVLKIVERNIPFRALINI